MISEKIKTIFSSILTVIFFLSMMLLFVLMNTLAKFTAPLFMDFSVDGVIIFSLLLLFMSYLYLLVFIVIIVGIFKKIYKSYFYIIFLTPSIPILFILYQIYQTRELIDNDILSISILYFIFLVFTAHFMKTNSYNIVGNFGGKEIQNMEDDYFAICILSENISEGEIDVLVEDIIENFLNYKFTKFKYIYDGGELYKILNFRKFDDDDHSYKNILLTKIYIEVTEDLKLIEITDNFKHGENVYECMYLFQYVDGGDKIIPLPSNFADVHLAIKGLLPEKTLIHYYKNDDITPHEIRNLHYKLFGKYLTLHYGTLLDKAEIKLKYISTRIKEPYKKLLKYSFISVVVIILLIYVYVKYLADLDIQIRIMIIFGFPAFVYYTIKTVEKTVELFKRKND